MFIAIEGIDGTGKSTQALLITEHLKMLGKDVLLTKEPGGWKGGEVFRKLVLEGGFSHPWSEAYLFLLDRAEHVAKVIMPALNENKTVICERYHASTLAYQVWGRGLPKKTLDELFRLSEFPTPDITVLFDMPVELALNRVSARGGADNFESEGAEFMEKIRRGYLEQYAEAKDRWVKISAEGTQQEVFERLTLALKSKGVL